jgi:hypothetical protein
MIRPGCVRAACVFLSRQRRAMPHGADPAQGPAPRGPAPGLGWRSFDGTGVGRTAGLAAAAINE